MTKKTVFAVLLVVTLSGAALAVGGLNMAQSLANTKSDLLAASFEQRWSALTETSSDVR